MKYLIFAESAHEVENYIDAKIFAHGCVLPLIVFTILRHKLKENCECSHYSNSFPTPRFFFIKNEKTLDIRERLPYIGTQTGTAYWVLS